MSNRLQFTEESNFELCKNVRKSATTVPKWDFRKIMKTKVAENLISHLIHTSYLIF